MPKSEKPKPLTKAEFAEMRKIPFRVLRPFQVARLVATIEQLYGMLKDEKHNQNDPAA